MYLIDYLRRKSEKNEHVMRKNRNQYSLSELSNKIAMSFCDVLEIWSSTFNTYCYKMKLLLFEANFA